MFILVISALILLLLVLFWEISRNRKVRFRRIIIPVTNNNLEKNKFLRILHLSDIHLTSACLDRLKIFDELAKNLWDFIFITGDLIDDDSGIDPVCQTLGRLKSRYGIYAVLGNHDYICFKAKNIIQWVRIVINAFIDTPTPFLKGNDTERLVQLLESNGILVLRNQFESGVIEDGLDYQIIGIDDETSGRDVLHELYECVNYTTALRLVLIHRPSNLEALKPFKPDLVLSGHTHGGQICLPVLGALSTHSDANRSRPSGLVCLNGLRLHISPGLGTGRIISFRILAPPEVTEIVLEYSQSAE